MATLDDIRTLGYTVDESNSTVRVEGYGLRWQLDRDDQAMIDELANPALHERRVARPSAPTTEEIENEQRVKAALRGELALLLQDAAALEDPANTYTAMQLRVRIARLERDLARLIRLAVRELSAA